MHIDVKIKYIDVESMKFDLSLNKAAMETSQALSSAEMVLVQVSSWSSYPFIRKPVQSSTSSQATNFRKNFNDASNFAQRHLTQCYVAAGIIVSANCFSYTLNAKDVYKAVLPAICIVRSAPAPLFLPVEYNASLQFTAAQFIISQVFAIVLRMEDVK